uniref:Uncharacterized protein n=1 Tax=Arundo donax TaxID=35708 RepID=A0A0A9F581_ARUDO
MATAVVMRARGGGMTAGEGTTTMTSGGGEALRWRRTSKLSDKAKAAERPSAPKLPKPGGHPPPLSRRRREHLRPQVRLRREHLRPQARLHPDTVFLREVDVLELDLSSMASVRRFAPRVRVSEPAPQHSHK